MSKTFTKKAKKYYIRACEKNNSQQDKSTYFCATSSYLTARKLDLKSSYVFLEQEPKKPKMNKILEYKLEAFMVREALKNTRILLPIKEKEWILLDAERNFAKEDLSGMGEGQRLDLLAYEESTRSYIVLELKINKEKKVADKADLELLSYTSTIKRHIQEANEMYAVNANRVEGYIVWPSNKNIQENISSWGLIEYEEEKLNDIENLKFTLIKEPC